MSYYSSYNQSSSALDLSLFEPRPEYSRQRTHKTTSAAAKKKNTSGNRSKTSKGRTAAAAQSRASSAGTSIANRTVLIRGIAFSVLIGLVITALVICRVQYHELIVEIDNANAQLEELQQDYEAMRVTFDTKMSDSAVEEYATTVLNMQKRENSQTEYITLGGGEVFEVTEGHKDWLDTGFDTLSLLMN